MRVRRTEKGRARQTKRAQVLMEPGEYERLERLAKQQETSVGELIRSAVREKYLGVADEAREAVRNLCALNIPIDDWAAIEQDVAEAHGEIDLP